MKQIELINSITDLLSTYAYKVEVSAKAGKYDIHVHSEDLFARLLNMLLDLELTNANIMSSTIEAIDLIDTTNKVVAQVSSQNDKKKITDSLKKNALEDYKGYRFLYVCISKNASDLRKLSYDNPFGLSFDPKSDIYDLASIIKIIGTKDIKEIDAFEEFLQDELGPRWDFRSSPTKIAHIINILAEENLKDKKLQEKVAFDISKKLSHNQIPPGIQREIQRLAPYEHFIAEIYAIQDKEAHNTSMTVLNVFAKAYEASQKEDPLDIYRDIKAQVKNKIKESRNFIKKYEDDLEYYIDLLTADAFCRCEIFEPPTN